jgi:hypothetical protein
MPESVRSRIISLSNSATLARIWNNSVFVELPSPKPLVKKQQPLRKCPQCDAMVRIDHMDDHRQKVHKPPKGKRLKGKQLKASRLKGAPKLGFKKTSTARSKSIRVVQGGLCSGR